MVEAVQETLGQYVARLRNEHGWTLRELGARSGLSHTYISKVEQGLVMEPSAAALAKIAHGLRVRVEVLDRLSRGLPIDAPEPSPEDRRRIAELIRRWEALPDADQEELIEDVEALLNRRERRASQRPPAEGHGQPPA